MKIVINACLAILVWSAASFAQVPSATNTISSGSLQATQLLQQALAALSPRITTRDTTLSGTVRYVVGSDDESGTATLKTIAGGASRVELQLPSGTRSEVRNLSAAAPTGSWSGPDGISHPISYHNLVIEPAWFSPVTAIFRAIQSPTSVATYVGVETLNDQAVQHVSVSQSAPSTSIIPSAFPRLTQIDLYLDAKTSLPAELDFKIHPDDNDLVDIPVEIRFSDYQSVAGTQIPLHIQKYVTETLLIDFQATSATINTGLAPTSFAVEATEPTQAGAAQ